MKIVTKNCSLTKGVRGYLIYLTDDNGNSLECHDVTGEEEREEKENQLSKENDISGSDVEYVSLEKYKSQNNNYTPLILVFYLNEELFTMQDAIKSYGENVRQYLENKGDNVRLFFLPTKEPEKITCINPVFIEDEGEFDKLNDLIEDISNKFQVGVE
jgi:hypothetical protein